MSYDVSLHVTGGGTYMVRAYDANITSNVAKMWREAGADLAEMKGMPAREAADLLSDAIDAMLSNPDKYRAMEPDNGWGTYEGCLQFLVKLHVACVKYPAAELSVHH